MRPILDIDSHRKPVSSAVLVRRGLIGRTGKVLGSPTLSLRHHDRGHVRLPLTVPDDAHLRNAAPRILERSAPATGQPLRAAVVMDRAGMGASCRFTMLLARHAVRTSLRTDQYTGQVSFTDVGPCTPLTTAAQGQVVRESASARFRLTVPDPAQERRRYELNSRKEQVMTVMQVALANVALRHPAPPTNRRRPLRSCAGPSLGD